MSESIWVEILGAAAGLLTTFSALPQLLTTYRTSDVRSFDLWFLAMLFMGLFLWVLYGVWIDSFSVAIFNAIGCLLWLPIIAMKIHSKASRKKRDTE